ncbi:MAG: entericidin A/B family lipoprotein [Burkholderiales bacterium]|nr:entericidin A/B family lipoprotein [Burkholderiales bacterium]MDP2241850.1 entericidin A/B family lipoprotein [Burkholderiales bacterium]
MKKIALILVALWAVALAGCNTMRGFGQDVEKAGETIQKKSDK